MTYTEVLAALSHVHGGSYVKAAWKSDVPMLKGSPITITKRSYGVVRVGVNYAAIDVVKRELAARGLTEAGPLPGNMAWDAKAPLVILDSPEGRQYVRLTLSRGPLHRTRTEYVLSDGRILTKEQAQKLNCVRPSYWAESKHDSPIFNVKIENLVALGD